MIATGLSGPHLRAMYDSVQRVLKDEGSTCYRRAGNPDGGWMVLDYVNVVIHVFSEAARRYYEIETLWAKAPTPEQSD